MTSSEEFVFSAMKLMRRVDSFSYDEMNPGANESYRLTGRWPYTLQSPRVFVSGGAQHALGSDSFSNCRVVFHKIATGDVTSNSFSALRTSQQRLFDHKRRLSDEFVVIIFVENVSIHRTVIRCTITGQWCRLQSDNVCSSSYAIF